MSRTALIDPPARRRLLQAAQALIISQGFPATTVDDICRAAGLTKGSFFHYFANKEELGAAVLDHFWESRLADMTGGPAARQKDPLKRLLGYVDLARRRPRADGCMLGIFAVELARTSPDLHARCRGHFEGWIRLMEGEMREAKTLHCPKASFDPKALAEHFVGVFEGAVVLAKAHKDWEYARRSLDQFGRYMKTLYEQ
jgi:TetR/AcrR family transcriptional regulator, transcriptional repressor for nem operon